MKLPATTARPKETVSGEMRYRLLGRTDEKVSVIGLGGYHIGLQKEEKESIRIIRAAIDAGITFMAHFRSFERHVLPVLVKEGIGVLGMKPLGSGAIVQSGAVSAIECLHFALNLPTSVVITGMESMARLDQALEAVRTFKKMSEAELASLLAKTAPLAATGQYERFKTSAGFDGTARHPEWLG